MSATLFRQRHYEFLARFSGRHLNSRQWEILADLLSEDNGKFKYDRFIRAVERELEVSKLA